MKNLWLVAVLVVFGQHSAAQTTDSVAQAKSALTLFETAQIRLEGAQGAGDRVKALTGVVKAYEEGLLAMRSGLRQLTLREEELSRAFAGENEDVSTLLGVLVGLKSDASPEALVHPVGPLGHARAGMLVSSVTPEMQAKANVLKEQLLAVSEVRQLQDRALDQLSTGLKDVQQARTQLSQAVSERVDLPKRFVTDNVRMKTLVDSADSLEAFAASIAIMDVVDGVNSLPSIADTKGDWDLPVQGQTLRKFNEEDAAGVSRPGRLLATRPLSIVTAPWPATIRYLGPFLDYGNVIILEPGNDVLLVLAGLDEVYGEVGEVISSGAAVGLMGGVTPQLDDFVQNASEGAGASLSETLYIEVREGGQPTDPSIWFKN